LKVLLLNEKESIMGYALTSKRQVTVPLQICNQLGIGPGQEIDYATLADGRVVIVPVSTKKLSIEEVLEKWRGTGVRKMTTEEIMRETRGEESMR
jgi:bifunctional DNA-binding transcriptional regulator/antitoxin component of YhaV-PrlF toxin-antitoxin module